MKGAFILFVELPRAEPIINAIYSRGLDCLVITAPATSSLEESASQRFADKDRFGLQALREILPERSHAIYQQVDEWRRSYKVLGLFCQSEPFVEPATVVADLLGLPNVGLRAARVCRNKHLQRVLLHDVSPEYELIEQGHVPRRTRPLPAVIKPVDLWASSGVQAVESQPELSNLLMALEPGEVRLLEARVTGREYSVDSLVRAGEILFTGVTQKATNEGYTSLFAELAHTYPAVNATASEEFLLRQAHERVVRELRFQTGMVHGEYRLTPNGVVRLMEIAARPPGDGSLPMYSLSTGTCIYDALVDLSLGGRPSFPAAVRQTKQIYFDHTPGILTDVHVRPDVHCAPYWAYVHGGWPSIDFTLSNTQSNVRSIIVLKRKGERLKAIRSSSDRAVTAIMDCPLSEDISDVEAAIRRSVQIVVNTAT